VTHREEMIGFAADAPQRLAIMFDLKEHLREPVTPPSGVPLAFPREGASKAIDNNRVIEWDHSWRAGQVIPKHVHDKDSVQVFFTGGTIKFTAGQGKAETKTFKSGDARFIAGGTVCIEEAISGTPRAVTIELK
jgi:hypothetical protein